MNTDNFELDNRTFCYLSDLKGIDPLREDDYEWQRFYRILRNRIYLRLKAAFPDEPAVFFHRCYPEHGNVDIIARSIAAPTTISTPELTAYGRIKMRIPPEAESSDPAFNRFVDNQVDFAISLIREKSTKVTSNDCK